MNSTDKAVVGIIISFMMCTTILIHDCNVTNISKSQKDKALKELCMKNNSIEDCRKLFVITKEFPVEEYTH